MTATEELRRLLDERGVEWRERVWGGKNSVTTFWHARGVRWHYRENRFGELRVHADGLSPEQAVEATLGRGTCKNRDADIYPGGMVFVCSACEGMSTDGQPNYCPNCGRKVVE